MNIKHNLLTILLTLLSTTAFASKTYYGTFEGCIDEVGGTSPLNVGDCYQGRVGFEQQTATIDITVTEFWFEIAGQKFSFDDFTIDEEQSVFASNNDVVQVTLDGTHPAWPSFTRLYFLYDLSNDYTEFTLLFGSNNDGGTSDITGGTIMYYPGSAPLKQMNVGLNDAWYDPATSGQGVFVTVLPRC